MTTPGKSGPYGAVDTGNCSPYFRVEQLVAIVSVGKFHASADQVQVGAYEKTHTLQSNLPTPCRKYFNTDLAVPKCLHTRRVQSLAAQLVIEDGLSYRSASWRLWRDHHVFVPFATLQNRVEAGGEKGERSHGAQLSGLGAG